MKKKILNCKNTQFQAILIEMNRWVTWCLESKVLDPFTKIFNWKGFLICHKDQVKHNTLKIIAML